MGLKKYIKKYSEYETKELARRSAKKRKIAPYKELANKEFPVKKPRKLTLKGFSKSIGNPYKINLKKIK